MLQETEMRRSPYPGRRHILGLGAGLLAPLAGPLGVAHAQPTEDWPARQVTIVEGYPPGTIADVASRAVADHMSRSLGKPVVVDNRPGAATSVATTAVSHARADGYTLVMGTTTLAINPTLQPNLTPKDPARELDAVGMVFQTPFILHVHPSVPARTTRELIDFAKTNPGKLMFASPGAGSVSHLCFELLRARTGVEVVHVPYRGGVQAGLDLRQGRVHAMFQAPLEAAPTLGDGATRGIAVTTADRIPEYPQLPPVADTLPGFEVTFWQGLFAPPGTPAPIVARVGAALHAATTDAELRTRLAEKGVQMLPGDARMLRDTLVSETRRWGTIIRDANIKAE